MILDAITQKPLVVSGADTQWPYIRLPLDQVPELRALLDRHGVQHTLRENAISFDGGAVHGSRFPGSGCGRRPDPIDLE